jgi:hypothetical protein
MGPGVTVFPSLRDCKIFAVASGVKSSLVKENYEIVVIDSHHRSVDTSSSTFDLYKGKQTVLGCLSHMNS